MEAKRRKKSGEMAPTRASVRLRTTKADASQTKEVKCEVTNTEERGNKTNNVEATKRERCGRVAATQSKPKSKNRSVKAVTPELNEDEKGKSEVILLAERICNEIKNIDTNYSKIDMNDWNLDEISEELTRSGTECPVQLTSADDVEESTNDHFACDEIYASGECDIKCPSSTNWKSKVKREIQSITAIPQLTYDHLRWLIKEKIFKDLNKISQGKLPSFYHTNFTKHKKEMPAALIRFTMFSDSQFNYICGCLKGLFVKERRVYELNYALHVLLPETLIRMVMFVKKVTYKDAQKLMDTHLFSKDTSGDLLE